MTEHNKLLDSNCKWELLDQTVSQIKAKQPNHPIWQATKDNPITTQLIDKSIEGWTVDFLCASSAYGRVFYEDRKMYLRYGMNPFLRDTTVCHELVHIIYPDILADTYGFRKERTDSETKYFHENGLIAEWLGRKARANPRLLKHTLNGFDLRPSIYDRSSFLAFGPHDFSLDNPSSLPLSLLSIPLMMEGFDKPPRRIKIGTQMRMI